MATYTKEELAELSGEKAYKAGPVGGQYFDTLTLGKDGKFYISYYSQPKDERDDPDMLGDKVKLTIIKIRRKVSQWVDKVNIMDCVEYDAGADVVHTTMGDMTEKEAKEKGAKVALVLYGLLKDKLVKFTVTGGSLYNPDDEQDLRLYSYLQSFEEDEHMFMFETEVCAKCVELEDKTFYQMTFKKGNEHNNLDKVGEVMTNLPIILKDNDDRDFKYLGKNTPSVTKNPDPIEYPTEEINPDDVPF